MVRHDPTDLAEMYNTDLEAAAALKQTAVKREDLFVTSKLLKSVAGDINEVRRMHRTQAKHAP